MQDKSAIPVQEIFPGQEREDRRLSDPQPFQFGDDAGMTLSGKGDRLLNGK
jgi:hypothetical protein